VCVCIVEAAAASPTRPFLAGAAVVCSEEAGFEGEEDDDDDVASWRLDDPLARALPE
jgi:hypothetical protein